MSLQKFKRLGLSSEILYWIDHNLFNYLKHNPENYAEIEHIIDYLSSDKAPKRLKKMSYEQAKNGAKKWTNALIKKGNNIVETDADIKTVIDFQDGFRLVRLLTKSAYQREGAMMRHCVGDYFNSSQSKIYSIRDVKNQSHCTIEINSDGDYINQIKGKGNGSIHPKYIKYVIQALQSFGVKVNEHEMSNLGYINLSEDAWKLLENTYTNIPFISFGGKKYFYGYGKLS